MEQQQPTFKFRPGDQVVLARPLGLPDELGMFGIPESFLHAKGVVGHQLTIHNGLYPPYYEVTFHAPDHKQFIVPERMLDAATD